MSNNINQDEEIDTTVDQGIGSTKEPDITRGPEIFTGTEECKLTGKLEETGVLDMTGNSEHSQEPHLTSVMGISEEPDPVEIDGGNATENCKTHVGIEVTANADDVDNPGMDATEKPKGTKLPDAIGDSGTGNTHKRNIVVDPDNDES